MRAPVPALVLLILNLLILALLVLMLWGIWPTKAKSEVPAVPPFELVIATYPSDHGHTIALRSYIDIFRAPYKTADDCEDAREYTSMHHEPYRDPKTLAVHLAEIYCVGNPVGKAHP